MYHGKSAGNEGQACQTNRSQSRQLHRRKRYGRSCRRSYPAARSSPRVRARRFLTHIVEQTLAGQTDGIKELVLGIEVFDRPADFDPKIDTIVRVEAGRLRKRLEEYYADEGAAAVLRIEVPQGSYVPQFQPRPPVSRLGNRCPRLNAPPVVCGGYFRNAPGCRGHLVGESAISRPRTHCQSSIAVLPFLNLSADPANEYFTDGLAEELTDALCNAGALRVASRTSAFFFKGRPSDAHEIGAKLHVAFVVEGSVRKQGGQLKVTAQLIRTDDGYHVWSGSFERQLSDVFKVQQELAGSLVTALQLKLTGAQTRRLKKTHTANHQAFDLYLQGRHVLTSFAPDSLDRAERLFQQSIAADPDYALSYVALAGSLRPSHRLRPTGRSANWPPRPAPRSTRRLRWMTNWPTPTSRLAPLPPVMNMIGLRPNGICVTPWN